MSNEMRRRAGSFGANAERYDRLRPGYPPALFDALAGAEGLRVLDVGCGTGIAARLLADRGCRVIGIEPDPRMAAVARGHGIDVEVGRFEDWDPAGRTFDLLTAAQSWHWVDPVAGPARAAAALGPAGTIGLFWNTSVLPDDIRGRLDEVYRSIGPELSARTTPVVGVDPARNSAAAGLADSGLFDHVERSTFDHEVTYSARSWTELLSTHSDHAILEAGRRERLLDAIRAVVDQAGGSIAVHYLTKLVRARRVGAPARS